MVLEISTSSNSLIALPSGKPDLTKFRIFFSANILGNGFDFCSHNVNNEEIIFKIDLELCNTTNSMGLDKSIEFSFSLIAKSSIILPSESIFCSKFSAFMSKTTSVIP